MSGPYLLKLKIFFFFLRQKIVTPVQKHSGQAHKDFFSNVSLGYQRIGGQSSNGAALGVI
jgi:hypothetical protein